MWGLGGGLDETNAKTYFFVGLLPDQGCFVGKCIVNVMRHEVTSSPAVPRDDNIAREGEGKIASIRLRRTSQFIMLA